MKNWESDAWLLHILLHRNKICRNLVWLSFHQMLVASVLGVPANRVVVRVKRLGKTRLHTHRKIINLVFDSQTFFKFVVSHYLDMECHHV